METILIVEDEAKVRAILRQALECEGYSVIEAENKVQAIHFVDTRHVNLVTLDLRLDRENGLDVAREIRAKRNIAIVMITGMDTSVDRLTGLESGADDYILKPFHLREVVLRIRNILARYAHVPTDPFLKDNAGRRRRYVFNEYTLDAQKRELRTSDGKFIDLTDFEFHLLYLLVENPARVLSRDEISQALCGRNWSPFDRTIDGHIARLRRKLEAGAEEPGIIKSVRGVGYVLASDVSVH